MNKLRAIHYFALFIVFCAEYRYVSNQKWPDKVRSLIDEATSVEPSEIMKVDVLNLFFEKAGVVEKSYAHESLTLITNEHMVQRNDVSLDANLSPPRMFYHFIVRLKNSDSNREPIFSFWSVEIRWFVHLNSAGRKMKLILSSEVAKGMIAVDFLNPDDVQNLWFYAVKNRHRKRVHMVDVMKFEIMNRRTKEKVAESAFASIHRESPHYQSSTYMYMISLEAHERDVRKPLLIFSSRRYSVSDIIGDRVGLLMLDEPNMVFILHFAPFENEAAVAFHKDIFARRCKSLAPISVNELSSFIT